MSMMQVWQLPAGKPKEWALVNLVSTKESPGRLPGYACNCCFLHLTASTKWPLARSLTENLPVLRHMMQETDLCNCKEQSAHAV